jgi:uncharacterized protein
VIPTSRVLLLPGWQNSGRGHWQTLWEARFGDFRVTQHDWMTPKRGDWMARLEDVVLASASATDPVVLAAHSLGCHLVAAWAAHSQNTNRVRGALLVAPPDPWSPSPPPELTNFYPPVLDRLPFASHVIASTNDPFGASDAARRLSQDWGSRFTELGECGHINADSGLGDWPQGRAWLSDWPSKHS